MDNLFKVECIYILNDFFPRFVTFNKLWDILDEDENGYGVVVLAKECVINVNGELFVDLNMFNNSLNKIIEHENRDKEEVLKKLKIKILPLDKKNAIYLGDKNDAIENIDKSGCWGAEIISANEYIIKQLLE